MTEESTPISRMTVHGFKGGQHVSIAPEGNVVTLAGANGAGKTSFIDAICELLDPKGVRLGPRLIHDGEKEARATLESKAGGWIAERVWKGQGKASQLNVTSMDGAKYPTPAKMLEKLVGQVTFDPTTFMFLDAKEQLAQLLEVVDLPFDLDEISREVDAATEARRKAKQLVAEREAQLAGLEVPAKDLPRETQSTTSILEDLRAAQKHNGSRADADGAVVRLDEQVFRLRRQLEEAEAAAREAREAAAALPPVIDTTPLEDRLTDTAAWNSKIEAAQRYYRLDDERSQAADAVAFAQESLDVIVERKRLGLEAAQFPVEGLGFDETGVTFEGTPFKQLNTAKGILVSAELAMVTKPAKVRIMRISHGSLLDAGSVAALESLAEKHDYLVLREVVDEHASPETTVVFTEGTAAGLGVVVD